MDDIPFSNKLVELKSGLKAAYQCWMCNIHVDFLDDPYKKSSDTNARTIAQKQCMNKKALKKLDIMLSRTIYSIS